MLVCLAAIVKTETERNIAGGGENFTGATTCASPFVCTVINPYYFQCLPAASGAPTTPPATPPPAPPTTTKPPSGPTSVAPAPPTGTGLDAHFKAKGKVFFGTAADEDRFSNPTDSAVTIANFGGLTPENSMKWDAVSFCSIFLPKNLLIWSPRLRVSFMRNVACC